MLKLKTLELQAIGRFVNKQTIDFTALGALAQVDGLNNNTGGSSGSAKSTIFKALDYLFGVNSAPTTVLQSRYTKETMTVVGTFDYDGKDLIISRGKKLSVTINGEVTTGNSKLTEEKLDEIIGMPRDLFRQMLHKRQKEGGFFLKLTPKEIHEFLTDCLGLGDLRNKIDKLDGKIKELSAGKEVALNSLLAAQAALQATQSASLAIGIAPVREVDQATIVDLKHKFDLVNAHFLKVQEAQRGAGAELDKQRPQLVQKSWHGMPERVALEKELKDIRDRAHKLELDEQNRQSGIKLQIETLKTEASSLNYDIQSGKAGRLEAAKLAGDIKKIRDALCPTCEQSWVTDAAKVKEKDILDKLLHFKDLIGKGVQAEARQKELEEQTKTVMASLFVQEPAIPVELREREDELVSLIGRSKQDEHDFATQTHYINQVQLNSFSDQQKRLKEQQEQEIGQVRGQLEINRRTLDTAVMKFKSYEEAKNKFEQTSKILKEQESAIASKIGDLTSKVGKLEQDLLVAEEIKRAIKTYTSCSFDDALRSIGDTATRIIRNIPNMANATIELEGTKETKEGKVKEEVNAVLSCDGEEGVPLKSLCGGEESAVDLAVDLAVIDFVENKANKGIDVFILDEPFTGMDTVIIEQALEVLKNANINKRLILVDHNPQVKEMMDSSILVIRDGLTSKIVQN